MRSFTAVFLCSVLFTAACSKKENDKPATAKVGPLVDFIYVPHSQAVWKVHTRGLYNETSQKVDTSVHYYHTITATGKDTTINSTQYYIYDLESRFVSGTISTTTTSIFFLRENTTYERVYAYGNPEIIVLDLATEEVGDDADVPQQWPESFISGTDSLVIAGQYLKMWNVSYKYDKTTKFFYKAYGVGGQTGVLPFITKGSQPISLDFTYKNENLHFDFELHN